MDSRLPERDTACVLPYCRCDTQRSFWPVLMNKNMRILGYFLIGAFLITGSAPRLACAQTSDVINFFANELDLGGGKKDEPPAPNESSQSPDVGEGTGGGGIGDLFGGVKPGVDDGASAGGGAVGARKQQYDPKQVENEIRNEAFNKALQGMLPMKPAEIRRLLEEFDRTQESYELPVYPMPKPEFTVQTLSLDPGAKPLTIRVAQGHVTTLNMLDVTGAPWPIEDITWAGNFKIIQSSSGENGVHFVRITPQSEFAYGNMSIKMIGLETPLIMTIETSRDLVHYRFDAIIPEYGPLAEAPLIEGGVSLSAGNPAMSSILQGIIPTGAKRMSVNGADSRTSVYQQGSKMYIRTPLTLLSPSWSSSVASADGMRVYTVKKAPVILLSDKGKMVRANISAQVEVFDE